jgi:SRSO17 transposase
MADQVWRVKAARVWLSSKSGWSAGTYWLLWASNDATGEEKFFLSNAPVETPVETLVRVGFRRAAVEHAFRLCKSELGFAHFEGRNYVALMRHLSLCLVALAFVADQTDRLRGEKSGGDGRAGVPGAGGVVPGLAAAAAADDRVGVCFGHPQLPPAAEPGREALPEEATARGPDPEETPATAAKTTKPMHSKITLAL